MLETVHEETRDCVDEPRRAGLCDDAERLDEALCGSRCGEILTDIGARVTSVRRSQARLPDGLRERLRNLRRAVDRVPGRAAW